MSVVDLGKYSFLNIATWGPDNQWVDPATKVICSVCFARVDGTLEVATLTENMTMHDLMMAVVTHQAEVHDS